MATVRSIFIRSLLQRKQTRLQLILWPNEQQYNGTGQLMADRPSTYRFLKLQRNTCIISGLGWADTQKEVCVTSCRFSMHGGKFVLWFGWAVYTQKQVCFRFWVSLSASVLGLSEIHVCQKMQRCRQNVTTSWIPELEFPKYYTLLFLFLPHKRALCVSHLTQLHVIHIPSTCIFRFPIPPLPFGCV